MYQESDYTITLTFLYHYYIDPTKDKPGKIIWFSFTYWGVKYKYIHYLSKGVCFADFHVKLVEDEP